MRHTARIKHIPADKPLNFLISSLRLYFCTSKSTRSINGIAFGHCFPSEFAIQDWTIWPICRNLHKCLSNIFLRLLIVNQDQRLVIALYYMFSSTSDENNINKQIFLIYLSSMYCISLPQQSHREVLQILHSTLWHNPEVLGPATYVFFLINPDYLRRKF